MRATAGAIAGAALGYFACAFIYADMSALAWGVEGRLGCIFAMYVFAGIGALNATTTRGA